MNVSVFIQELQPLSEKVGQVYQSKKEKGSATSRKSTQKAGTYDELMRVVTLVFNTDLHKHIPANHVLHPDTLIPDANKALRRSFEIYCKNDTKKALDFFEKYANVPMIMCHKYTKTLNEQFGQPMPIWKATKDAGKFVNEFEQLARIYNRLGIAGSANPTSSAEFLGSLQHKFTILEKALKENCMFLQKKKSKKAIKIIDNNQPVSFLIVLLFSHDFISVLIFLIFR